MPCIVLVIDANTFGGGEALLSVISEGLSQGMPSHEIIILSSNKPIEIDRSRLQVSSVKQIIIPYGDAGISLIARLFNLALFAIHVIRFLCRPSTTIHAHSFPSSYIVGFLSRFFSSSNPKILTVHGLSTEALSPFQRSIKAFAFGAYDAITFVSKESLYSFERAVSVSAHKVVIYNGIEMPPSACFQAINKSQPVRFVSAARLVPLKGIHDSITYLGMCHNIPRRYFICGSGPELESLRQLAFSHACDCGFDAEFLGRLSREDVSLTIASCNIGIVPSLTEGFSLFLVECLAHGRPVLCRDLQVLREIGSPSCCAYFHDFLSFKYQLNYIIRNYDSMSFSALRHAERYSSRRMVLEYIRLYESWPVSYSN